MHFGLSPSVLRSWLLGQEAVKSNHVTGFLNREGHLLLSTQRWWHFGLLASCYKASRSYPISGTDVLPGDTSCLQHPEIIWFLPKCSWDAAFGAGGGGAEPSLLSEQLLTWLTLPVYSYVWPESRLYKRHRTGLKAHVPLQITIPFTHLPSLICSPPLSL